MRSARFVRHGTGKGRVFEKGSRAYLFRSSAPPTRPTRKSARLLDRQLSSDVNCRTRHRCGDKRSGVGIRGSVGGSQGVLEQRAGGRASPGMLCAGRGRSAAFTIELGALNKMPRGGQKFLGCTICLEADRVVRSLCVAKKLRNRRALPWDQFPRDVHEGAARGAAGACRRALWLGGAGRADEAGWDTHARHTSAGPGMPRRPPAPLHSSGGTCVR